MDNTLVMPNRRFTDIIMKSLQHRQSFTMTQTWARQLLMNNDRAKFWGLTNALHSALADTDIKYRETMNNTFIFTR